MKKQTEQYFDYLYKIGILNTKMRQKFYDLVQHNLSSSKTPTPVKNNNKNSHIPEDKFKLDDASVNLKLKQSFINALKIILAKPDSGQLEELSTNLFENFRYQKRQSKLSKLERVFESLKVKELIQKGQVLSQLRLATVSLTQTNEIKKLKTYVEDLISENQEFQNKLSTVKAQNKNLKKEIYELNLKGQKSSGQKIVYVKSHQQTRIPFKVASVTASPASSPLRNGGHKKNQQKESQAQQGQISKRLYRDTTRFSSMRSSMNQCTFQPKVHSRRPLTGSASTNSLLVGSVSTDSSIFSHLYDQRVKYQAKDDQQKKIELEMEGCTFKPKILKGYQTIRERYQGSHSKGNNQNEMMMQENQSHLTIAKSSPLKKHRNSTQNVFNGLYSYGKEKMLSRRMQSEKQFCTLQEQELKNCTFTPKINNRRLSFAKNQFSKTLTSSCNDMRSNSNKPVTPTKTSNQDQTPFGRLYLDSIRRNQDFKQRAQNELIQIKNGKLRSKQDQASTYNKLYEQHEKLQQKKNQKRESQIFEIKAQTTSLKARPLPKFIQRKKEMMMMIKKGATTDYSKVS